MSKNVINLDQCAEITKKKIFIDANIFMFVDGIFDYDGRTKRYSDAYFGLQKSNTLFTNEWVISEYCNRAFKYSFELESKEVQNLKVKDYRSSATGLEVLATIIDSAKHFLKEVELFSVRENFPDIGDLLSDFSTGKLDLPDSAIANICLANEFLVLSDDRDLFCKGELEIITDNWWMIQNSQNRAKFSI